MLRSYFFHRYYSPEIRLIWSNINLSPQTTATTKIKNVQMNLTQLYAFLDLL